MAKEFSLRCYAFPLLLEQMQRLQKEMRAISNKACPIVGWSMSICELIWWYVRVFACVSVWMCVLRACIDFYGLSSELTLICAVVVCNRAAAKMLASHTTLLRPQYLLGVVKKIDYDSTIARAVTNVTRRNVVALRKYFECGLSDTLQHSIGIHDVTNASWIFNLSPLITFLGEKLLLVQSQRFALRNREPREYCKVVV